jgi:tRNA pseudouridine65 synthase
MILHQDDVIVVVNKPAGMPVHRSRLVSDGDVYLIDVVRAQVPGPLHLIHRLDRATSGVLLIGRSPEVAATLGQQFMQREVCRRPIWPCAVAGLRNAARSTIPCPACVKTASARRPSRIGDDCKPRKYPLPSTAIRSNAMRWWRVTPETGRYRQIRRHFAHLRHPLIGDTSHGRTEHNRLFKQYFGSHRLLLHAHSLSFDHPLTGHRLCLDAALDTEFTRVLHAFGWSLPHATSRASSALPHPLL